MSLADFARKEVRIARKNGLRTAIKAGTAEVGWKAMDRLTPWVGTPVWDADWDVCLVLDACRVDLLREVAPEYDWLSDHVETRWSVGSASPEWISETFAPAFDARLEQTGYVTANPFSGRDGTEQPVMDPEVYPLSSPPLAYLDEVWRDQWPDDGTLPTIEPPVMTERAMWAYQEDVADRLLVHYMQPHIPFRSQPEWCDGWDLSGFGTSDEGKDDWHKVRDGEIDADAFWGAYRDNLRWVLEEVERWYRATDARILITSDHGNGMGEWGVWSHPPGVVAPQVRKVPWVIVEGVGEKEIAPEPVGDPPVTEGVDHDVEEQLEALGYR